MNKIYYLANVRIPTEKAHGMAIMKMCEAFADQGMEVELIIPRRFNSIKENPFDFYDVKRNFKIKRLFCLDLINLGKMGFLIQALSFAKFAFLYSLFRKADYLYGRDELSLFFLSLFRDNVVWETHTAKNSWFVKVLLKRSKAIIAISQGLKDYYVSLGVDQNKILVAHSGVDLSVFENIRESKEELRKKLDLPLDKKIVAYIGKRKGMGESKGVEELEESFKFVTQNHPEIYFLVVSDISPKLAPLYMKAVDVLVMNYPNAEHYAKYMSPLKMFEYMASGTPIISTDLPSIREVLDESSAAFFSSGNQSDLAQTLKGVISNHTMAQSRAKKALEIVKKYSWTARVKRVKVSFNE